MNLTAKSYVSGAVCGALVSWVSIYSIAVTAAIAMPHGFPSDLWQVIIVFGLGAFLPAFAIYCAILLIFRPNLLASLTGFCIAVIAGMAWFVGLLFAGSALAAVVLAALAATAFAGLRSNNSLKPDPLRGSA